MILWKTRQHIFPGLQTHKQGPQWANVQQQSQGNLWQSFQRKKEGSMFMRGWYSGTVLYCTWDSGVSQLFDANNNNNKQQQTKTNNYWCSLWVSKWSQQLNSLIVWIITMFSLVQLFPRVTTEMRLQSARIVWGIIALIASVLLFSCVDEQVSP